MDFAPYSNLSDKKPARYAREIGKDLYGEVSSFKWESLTAFPGDVREQRPSALFPLYLPTIFRPSSVFACLEREKDLDKDDHTITPFSPTFTHSVENFYN